MAADEPIFHLALPTDWADALPTGEYRVSTRGRTLDEEGFIHCSRREQLEPVANMFYADVPDLVLLTIDPDRVPSDIVEEPPVPGSPERFPHIYGPLPVSAVVTTRAWMRGAQGWVLDDT